MAINQYLVSSSRAGLGSVIVTRDVSDTLVYLISGVGLTPSLIASGAAAMDGVASVGVAAFVTSMGAAQMDGQAQLDGISVLTGAGDGAMDGQALVTVDGLASAVGRAQMDGQAQLSVTSVNAAAGAAQMDGRASSVVAQSVPGAGLTEMDGEASMLAVAPNIHRVNIFETVIGGEATSMLTHYKPVMSQGITNGEVIAASARYKRAIQSSIILTDTVINRMKFIKLIREILITLTTSLEPHLQYGYEITLPISVRPELAPSWSAVLALVENLLVDETINEKFIWGRTLKDGFRVSSVVGRGGIYYKALTELFKLVEAENFILRHPVALSQDIDLSPLLTGAFSLKLLQKFLAGTLTLPGFSYHLGLASRVRLGDALEHLVHALLEQLFTVQPAVDRQFIANNSLSQLLTIHPAFTNKLILKLVGDIQLSPEQLVSMLYAGDPLLDGVAITALYISPVGTTTTWAVNTRTNAITEYLNYDFRSFASMGNRYIAAGPGGLYELDGDTDDGALIISRLMSGYLQLNAKKLFGIKGAYVAIRGGGRFYLKLISGDGREYVYELRAQPNLMTTKIKVGKGIRTTYMAFELVTEGQDFDLDSIEFIPMMSERRV
jgi:hypothetical protein